jgi:hypothetical protein
VQQASLAVSVREDKRTAGGRLDREGIEGRGAGGREEEGRVARREVVVEVDLQGWKKG